MASLLTTLAWGLAAVIFVGLIMPALLIWGAAWAIERALRRGWWRP